MTNETNQTNAALTGTTPTALEVPNAVAQETAAQVQNPTPVIPKHISSTSDVLAKLGGDVVVGSEIIKEAVAHLVTYGKHELAKAVAAMEQELVRLKLIKP